jgi:hypothetical protein
MYESFMANAIKNDLKKTLKKMSSDKKDTSFGVDKIYSTSLLDVVQQGVSLVSAIFSFLLIVAVGWMAVEVYQHWNIVYSANMDHLSSAYKASEKLMIVYCSSDPSYAATKACRETVEFLQVPLLHRVWDDTIQEHMDHLPFVKHCRTTDECKQMVYWAMDLFRANFWVTNIILSIFAGWGILSVIKQTYRSYNQTLSQYKKTNQVPLPQFVRPVNKKET